MAMDVFLSGPWIYIGSILALDIINNCQINSYSPVDCVCSVSCGRVFVKVKCAKRQQHGGYSVEYEQCSVNGKYGNLVYVN